MMTIHGTGASPGMAAGKLYWYKRAGRDVFRMKETDVSAADPSAEEAAFRKAQRETIRQLGVLAEKARAEVGEEAASLFETHQFMAEDMDFEDAILTAIREKKWTAAAAVTDAATRFMDMFASMEDPYFQARSEDVKDVSRRILSVLAEAADGGFNPPEPAILASDDLSPSETVQLEKGSVLGFVTSKGSVSGHTAILARTMGIPAIVGLGDQLLQEQEGCFVLLNGETGEVIVEPDPETLARFQKEMEKRQKIQEDLDKQKGLPSVTQGGKSVRICCNIGSPKDVSAVLQNDGEGIGLFRSEFLYLGREDLPDEETQFTAYKQVLASMGDRPVIIRTMDIGADKQVDYLQLPKEENPALGIRALRICLNRPEIFRTQLRALYRASVFGRLGIMFPMVTSVWEVQEAKKICAEVRQELAAENIPVAEKIETGVMIETPAAVMISDLLAKEVDFFSCGTNDLTQYMLACDRQGTGLGRFYDPHHPAVIRALRLVCENAHKNGIWVGVCGELGADPAMTEEFLAMGMDELSVSPQAVLPLRKRIREM